MGFVRRGNRSIEKGIAQNLIILGFQGGVMEFIITYSLMEISMRLLDPPSASS